MQSHCLGNKTYYHKKGFAHCLVLKVSVLELVSLCSRHLEVVGGRSRACSFLHPLLSSPCLGQARTGKWLVFRFSKDKVTTEMMMACADLKMKLNMTEQPIKLI